MDIVGVTVGFTVIIIKLEVAVCPAKQVDAGVKMAVIWSLLFNVFELKSSPVPPGTGFPLINHWMISPVFVEFGVAIKSIDWPAQMVVTLAEILIKGAGGDGITSTSIVVVAPH